MPPASGGGRLRPIDLARAAGISTQQVRNDEDAGVLPPVERSPTGYRIYDQRHRHALVTYRGLVRGYGKPVAQAIMYAVHEGDLARALALLDESHAALHAQRVSLHEVGEALQALAEQPEDASVVPRSGLRIGQVAKRLGIRASALRVWEHAGLLSPEREPTTGYRRFGAAEVRDARFIHLLRQGGYLLDQIRPVLEGLRENGSTDALRAALRDRQAALTWRSTAMLEGASRLQHYLNAGGDHPS